MSMRDALRWRVEEKRLHPLPMLVPWSTPVRAMLVTSEILDLLSGPWDDDIKETRAGRLHADLETFVTGDHVTHRYLKRLSPARDRCWEIRSVSDDPSIRVLGAIAEQNVFIAINFARREDLGGWRDRRWRDFKEECKAQWRNLFHPYEPMAASVIHDVVSGAIDGRYFR